MKKIKGIGASEGISIASTYILKEEELDIKNTKTSDVVSEKERFFASIEEGKKQIEALKQNALENIGKDEAAVFDAHIGILTDPEMSSQTVSYIENNEVNASFAFNEVSKTFIQMFQTMEDEYMKERAADISDVATRLLKILEGINIVDLTQINKEVVIISHDLTPSETSQLNPKFVKGFITEIGGRTSHSAIMARTLGIPAVVGVGKEVFTLEADKEVILDGSTGEIIYEPEEEFKNEYINKIASQKKDNEEIKKYINLPSVSKDG